MLNKLITASAGLLLTANVALAAGNQTERKDFQILKDGATSVERYTQFTIFADVSASVKDGVVTLTGKATMTYKRDDIWKHEANIDELGTSRIEINDLPSERFVDKVLFGIDDAD